MTLLWKGTRVQGCKGTKNNKQQQQKETKNKQKQNKNNKKTKIPQPPPQPQQKQNNKHPFFGGMKSPRVTHMGNCLEFWERQRDASEKECSGTEHLSSPRWQMGMAKIDVLYFKKKERKAKASKNQTTQMIKV